VQDYYGWAVNIESDIPERNEGDEGETILSWRRVVAVICVWSLRSLLDAKIKREGRGGEGGMEYTHFLRVRYTPN
jgi:hypothetical protein